MQNTTVFTLVNGNGELLKYAYKGYPMMFNTNGFRERYHLASNLKAAEVLLARAADEGLENITIGEFDKVELANRKASTEMLKRHYKAQKPRKRKAASAPDSVAILKAAKKKKDAIVAKASAIIDTFNAAESDAAVMTPVFAEFESVDAFLA